MHQITLEVQTDSKGNRFVRIPDDMSVEFRRGGFKGCRIENEKLILLEWYDGDTSYNVYYPTFQHIRKLETDGILDPIDTKMLLKYAAV